MVYSEDTPLVSVILTTRDRPRLLSVALACYQHQTYPRRELIVVDDGSSFPADARAVAATGGQLVRVDEGTPLGVKLNRGVTEARGSLCQKMDDDDWYGPDFLSSMVSALQASWTDVCRPTLAFLQQFLFFEIARWQIRQSVAQNVPGATLLFAREDWEEKPFRSVRCDEDVWYLVDQLRHGTSPLPVRALEAYMAVRHGGGAGQRGHTWTHQASGQLLETYLEDRPLHDRQPEELLPGWALNVYRNLHREQTSNP